MRVAVLTISDSVARGEREDLSGPAVVALCRGLGWEVVTSLRISDDALRGAFPWDEYELARSLVENGVPEGELEQDLFAGIRTDS